jgi:glycosyltransferase involved in cell wall biosynthesis
MSLGISIITCTSNSADYLNESIASVLAQDYPDVEYIFVDAGSTDGTLEMIRAMPRPYRLIENMHGGISHVMNAGMRAATGDIITHLHADGYYLRPDVLSAVVRNLESSRLGWLFGRITRSMNGVLQTEGRTQPRYSYACLLERNFIPRPATFVRRELINRVGGFDTNLKYAMDYDLWLKIGCLSEPQQLDEPLAMIREYEGSLFARKRLAAMEEDLVVRLAHVGAHPLARTMHYVRHFYRRQRAALGGTRK